MLAEIRPGKLVASPLYTHPESRGGDADYGGPTINGTATMCVTGVTRVTGAVFHPQCSVRSVTCRWCVHWHAARNA